MDREKAIEQIKWYFEKDDGISAEDITKESVYMAIEALSKERTGEWVDYGDEEYICSKCGYSKVHEPNYPFCPNCGAKMGGDLE